MQEIKVIVKRERQLNPTGTHLLLFFPESSANPPNIECWDGAHNEASMGYFWGLKNPREEDEADVDKLFKHYENFYGFKPIRILRDSQKMRVERWKRGGE